MSKTGPMAGRPLKKRVGVEPTVQKMWVTHHPRPPRAHQLRIPNGWDAPLRGLALLVVALPGEVKHRFSARCTRPVWLLLRVAASDNCSIFPSAQMTMPTAHAWWEIITTFLAVFQPTVIPCQGLSARPPSDRAPIDSNRIEVPSPELGKWPAFAPFFVYLFFLVFV